MTPDKYPLESLLLRALSPFEEFLHRTTAGGIVLIAATLAALGLASVFGTDAITRVLEQKAGFLAGSSFAIELSWHHWVNDGLMALFFLLVGLELKREVLVGELSSLQDAALPVAGALGGMVVPALLYAAFNAGTPTASGWGIPMATDIAFAIGILVLLASRIPPNLVIFLTALAIADDLGAVLVLALFYTAQIDGVALGIAAALGGFLVLLNRGGVRHPLPYGLVGVLLWYAVLKSGVHATIAGIVLALTIPARPSHSPAQFQAWVERLLAELRADRRDRSTPDDPLRNARMETIARAMERASVTVQSPLQRIEHGLSPGVTFLVIPIFALANAAIDLASVDYAAMFATPVAIGVFTGLVAGKFTGISLFSFFAVKLGWARLPAGVEWRHLLGAAWLAGIGFTMSLFIAQIAFSDPAMVEPAKVGILAASAVSAAIGVAWLFFVGAKPREASPA